MNKIILFLLCFLLGSSFSTFAQGRDREIKISRQQESPVKTVKVRGKGKIKNVWPICIQPGLPIREN